MLNELRYSWGGLVDCISEGNWLPLEKFRWYFPLMLPLYNAFKVAFKFSRFVYSYITSKKVL